MQADLDFIRTLKRRCNIELDDVLDPVSKFPRDYFERTSE